jgi:nondiscriminating glutamyl-tRNA synthetase
MTPDARGMEFLASTMTMVTASVDRLNQVPARLGFLFDYAPDRTLDDPAVRDEMNAAGARAVVDALAEELASAPRLDRDRFRAIANHIKVRTGQKAKALFHPIRVALTGRSEGPELDLAVPAVDRGAELPPGAGLPKIVGNRERAAAYANALQAIHH